MDPRNRANEPNCQTGRLTRRAPIGENEPNSAILAGNSHRPGVHLVQTNPISRLGARQFDKL